jgi:serine phosphatase RsbU (regulator of sigma subunit)
LRTAQAIQHAFLPKDVPTLPGWQIVPYYRPAREVGGDFYDFLLFADGRLGLIIGDVTGKGIPAALVMATVHTMLRTAVQGVSLRKLSPAAK